MVIPMLKKQTTIFLATLLPCAFAFAMPPSDKNEIVKELNDQLIFFGCVQADTRDDAWQVLKTGKNTLKTTENQLTTLSKAPFEFLAPISEADTSGLVIHEVENGQKEKTSRRASATKFWKLTDAGKSRVSQKCKGLMVAKPVVQNASLTPISSLNGVRTTWMQFDLTFGDTPIGEALSRDIYQIKIPQRYVYQFQYKDNKWVAVHQMKY